MNSWRCRSRKRSWPTIEEAALSWKAWGGRTATLELLMALSLTSFGRNMLSWITSGEPCLENFILECSPGQSKGSAGHSSTLKQQVFAWAEEKAGGLVQSPEVDLPRLDIRNRPQGRDNSPGAGASTSLIPSITTSPAIPLGYRYLPLLCIPCVGPKEKRHVSSFRRGDNGTISECRC